MKNKLIIVALSTLVFVTTKTMEYEPCEGSNCADAHFYERTDEPFLFNVQKELSLNSIKYKATRGYNNSELVEVEYITSGPAANTYRGTATSGTGVLHFSPGVAKVLFQEAEKRRVEKG